MSVLTVAVSMHVRCASCSSTIYIGSIVDRARCPSCGLVESLPPERWRTLLDTAANDAPNFAVDSEERTEDKDEAWIVTHRRPPVCASCKKPLAPNAAQNAKTHGKCFCGSCGTRIHVRPVPFAFAKALPQISHLLGEDSGQIKSPDAPLLDPSRAVTVSCPECGGKIQPDGRSRAVRCPYCSVMAVIPQSVWRRFSTGSSEGHTFYLVHDPAMPKPLGRGDVKWRSVYSLVCDPHGNIFGIGSEDRSFVDDRMVWMLGPDLQTKWVHKGLPFDQRCHIAWRNDGVIFAWMTEGDRFSAIVLRAADGTAVGKVGIKQSTVPDRHVLDFSIVKSIAVDFDGTFLGVAPRRVVRFAPDGTGIPMWPPKGGLFGGLFDEKTIALGREGEDYEYKSLYEVGDRPWNVSVERIRIGWDGRIYFAYSEHVVCFDRTGKKMWHVELPRDHRDLGIDARGNVYVLTSNSDVNTIFHINAGGQYTKLVDGDNPHTPFTDAERIAVRPDGTIIAGGGNNQLHIFAPNGQLLHRTPSAVKNDKEHYDKRAKKRDRDEL